MNRPGLSIAILCLTAPVAFASTATTNVPTGQWLTADQSAVIQIAPCGGDGLCGQIVGIRLAHPGDPMPQDWQGQPQCGLTIIQTTPETDAGTTVWKGVVLDPRNGAFHPARLALDAFRRLVLRGYMFIPLFGRSTTWTKYTGQTLPNCHLPG